MIAAAGESLIRSTGQIASFCAEGPRNLAKLNTSHQTKTEAKSSNFEFSQTTTLISLATSPFFGLALIVIGVAGIPTVTDRLKDNPIHRVWPMLGWAIFIICASILGSALLFGDYAFSSGAVEARRFYIEQHTERHLNEEQRATLCRWVRSADKQIFSSTIVTSDAAPESVQYATEIYEQMKACGAIFVNAMFGDFVQTAITQSTKTKGFYIVVPDKANPPANAQALYWLLLEAGFPAQYFTSKTSWAPVSLYVGPR